MFWEMWELEEIIRQLWMLPDLLLSILLGFAIGFERKLRFKEAGIRTHTVVCFGAALMMLISNTHSAVKRIPRVLRRRSCQVSVSLARV